MKTAIEHLADLTPAGLDFGRARYWVKRSPTSAGQAYDTALKAEWLIVWSSRVGIDDDIVARAQKDAREAELKAQADELATGEEYIGPSPREAALAAVRAVITRHAFIAAVERSRPDSGRLEGAHGPMRELIRTQVEDAENSCPPVMRRMRRQSRRSEAQATE